MRRTIATFALLAAAVCVASAATFDFRWIDVAVYEWGGETVFDASNLYDTRHPELGMPFTYTPFAALVFAALAPAALLTPIAWTLVSLAALVRASWLMARHRSAWLANVPAAWASLAIAAGVLATQPGTNTVRLGQVGFVLLWLVCEDLLGPARRSQGVLVGLATAAKLTPGAFVLLLLVVGRVRAAALAIATVAVTIAGAWLLLPTESASYWRHLGPDVTTVGPVTAVDHWSINATIWRIAGSGGNDTIWLLLAATTMLTTLALARVWWRGGEPLGAIGLVALGSVLASPFSWSHHWVAVAPLFVALLDRASRIERIAVACAYALTITGVWWHGPRFIVPEAVAANSYLVVAVVLLGMAWHRRPVGDGPVRASARSAVPEHAQVATP